MSKKLVLAVMLAVLPFALFAAGEIDSSHWTYKDIKSLIDAGVITKSLDKESLTRDEVVEYINDGVANVLYAADKPSASGSASTKELSKQIDKLYELVKAYMTDMLKNQQKLDDILNTIGDLKVKKAEIEKKQDKLLNSLGMRINGESSAYMTDLLLFGDSYVPSERVRPITQYLDMMFSLHASKVIYAEATFRMLNFFGGYWGSFDVVGLKRFFVQGNLPVAFIFGDYQAKLTPFTLWAVDDERPFESRLFSDKREMNKKELNLTDNSWPLTGGKAHTIVSIADAVDVELQVLGARLQEAEKSSKPAPLLKYNFTSDIYTTASYTHDQYLLGGRVASDFYLNEILKGLAKINIGVNFVEIVDAKDTGVYASKTLDNYVGSADLKAEILDGVVKVDGEFAMSYYTDDKWVKNYVTDTGIKAGAELKLFDTKLRADFIMNGRDFTAYAAQTRIFNEAENVNGALYLTQNNTWNLQNKPPKYEVGGHVYPFTQYNPQIVVSYNGAAGIYGNLLGYPVYENNLLPYGDASPDRTGIVASLSGTYLEEMIKPMVKFGMMSEAGGYKREIMSVEAGAEFNYWIFKLTGGYKMEMTQI
ncbi:MAG TPA: hypothetical protein P5511_03915, partial [Candidatus Goldiibacteriota bacterium]|nr:hypothetical protein [Candidatus Goldiibacteriota bacterium]